MSDLLVHGAFTATSAARLLRESPGRTTVLWHDGPPGDWVGAAEVLTPDRFLGASEFDLIDGKCGAILEGFHRPPGAGDGAVWEGLPLGEALGGYDQVGLMLPRLVNLVLARRVLAAKTPVGSSWAPAPGFGQGLERLADGGGSPTGGWPRTRPPRWAEGRPGRAGAPPPPPRLAELPARLGMAGAFSSGSTPAACGGGGRVALRRGAAGANLVLCPPGGGSGSWGAPLAGELFRC